MKIYLLRHGQTQGNKERRFIGGRTDEGLSQEGRVQLKERAKVHMSVAKGPSPVGVSPVVVSPMKRCIETAQIVCGEQELIIDEDLREMDFGEFENKNHEELDGNPDYQAWIDSNCEDMCPGGESKEQLVNRSMRAYRRIIDHLYDNNIDTAVVVCHGGNIMAILSELTGEDFYNFHVGNGEGYEVKINESGISYNRI